MLRVHLSGMEMGELLLDTWRDLRMAAAKALACPAGEAQKTFHNEVAHVSPQKPKRTSALPKSPTSHSNHDCQGTEHPAGCHGPHSMDGGFVWHYMGWFSLSWEVYRGLFPMSNVFSHVDLHLVPLCIAPEREVTQEPSEAHPERRLSLWCWGTEVVSDPFMTAVAAQVPLYHSQPQPKPWE